VESGIISAVKEVTNYYHYLGVSSEASLADIKAAYRKKSLSLHPDRGGSAEAMAQLNGIYETLSDTLKRHDYDTSIRPKPQFSPQTHKQPAPQAAWATSSQNASASYATGSTYAQARSYAGDWESTGGSARFWRGFAVVLILAALFLGYQVIQIFNPPASSANALTPTVETPVTQVGTATQTNRDTSANSLSTSTNSSDTPSVDQPSSTTVPSQDTTTPETAPMTNTPSSATQTLPKKEHHHWVTDL